MNLPQNTAYACGGEYDSSLPIYKKYRIASLLCIFKTSVFETIMENGAFAQKSKCSISINIFKSIQNFAYFFLEFFQCPLKIEKGVMI